jgi:hypothetical protein
MRPPSIGGLVHVGLDVLSTSVNPTTNKILCQTGNAVSSSTDANAVEWWQTIGFVSRPSKPLAGKSAAQCVVLKTSDRDVAVASQDTRSLEIYGNLKDGEFCAFAGGEFGLGQARILGKQDGSLTFLTTDTNTADGTTIALRIAPTELRFTAPWGDMIFDASGFHVKTLEGPRFDMGGINIPGLPAALSGPLSGYAKISAPVIKLDGAGVFLGAGATFQPTVYAPLAGDAPPTPTQASVAAALATFADTVGSAVGSIVAGGSGAAAGATITAASKTLAAALSAAAPTVQSQTCWTAP